MKQDDWGQEKMQLLPRLLLVYLLVALWALALVFRLTDLQVFKGEKYSSLAEQQQLAFVELSPKRGDILDRHLGELAISVQVQSVFAHPREVEDPLAEARTLAPILGIPVQDLHKKLISKRSFIYVARKIPPQQAEQIAALKLPGIFFQKESKRYYPGHSLAAQVLGFVGIDNDGLSGLEYLYNSLLEGKKRRVHLRVDARRQSFQSEPGPEQTDGNTMILSLDRSIQYITEQVLRETAQKSRALNATAIVMNPNNGEILAMASYPTFDPNFYYNYPERARRNRAILDVYEPGSAFKIVPLSAVQNEHLVEPAEIIDCRVGNVELGGKVFREAEHSYGLLSFDEVLARSSNVGTIELGLRLGEAKLYHYVKLYGFGEKTGIDLPGEESGILRPLEQWSGVSIGSLCIGQEIGITALQMVRAMAVIANDGKLVRPHVVRRIVTPAGDTVLKAEESSRQVISPATTRRMKQALAMVVSQGTGVSAALDGYSCGGKTGTAQKFVNGRYSHRKFVASFVGFAPLADPVLAAIVVVNEPQGEYYASQVAAPAFREIMQRSLIHMKVPQDQPTWEDAPLRARAVAMASSAAPAAAVTAAAVRHDRAPIRRTSKSGVEQQGLALTESKRVVTIQAGAFKLADFRGESLREVARECARLGLRLKIFGSGVAVGQRPEAGALVTQNSVCEVYFSTPGREADAPAGTYFKTSGGLDRNDEP